VTSINKWAGRRICRDPRNFTLEEWQQAQRQGKDPRDTKRALHDAWAMSDDKHSFEAALSERGFLLANGKRPFVAVDMDGEVHSLPRALKLKTKDLRAKLGPEDQIQSLEMAQATIERHMSSALGRLQKDVNRRQAEQREHSKDERSKLVKAQRLERKTFIDHLKARQQQEAKQRASRFRKGLTGLWDLVRGENRRIRKENEQDAKCCQTRDKKDLNAFIKAQMDQRRSLTHEQQRKTKELSQLKQKLDQSYSRQRSNDRGMQR